MSASKRLLFVVLCTLLGLTSCVDSRQSALQKTSANAAPNPQKAPPPVARPQYPFSVVAGGVYNREELARARRTDRVVREHYAAFGENPEFKTAMQDLLVFVSYRKRDKVYWTRTKHLVKRGETIVSDGGKLARARCGNQLSMKPQGPVEGDDEPAEDVLSVPAPPANTLQATAIPGIPEASSYVAPSSFADYPLVASPVKGGTIEITGPSPAGSGGVPSFPNALARSVQTPSGAETPATTTPIGTTTPAGSDQPAVTTPAPGGAGNGPTGETPTGDVPTFEPPFVAPRPPLAPVPEPNVSKTMWLVLLGGLACLTIRKNAGSR